MPITGFDPARNFAIANLASGITNVATSITLATGKGALFPDPSADGAFNVPLYNSTDYTAPWLDPDVEIVRVTARSTDTLTVTRAQEGTSAVAHNTGGKTYSLYMTFTQKAYDDLVTALRSPNIIWRVTHIGIYSDDLNSIPVVSTSNILTLRKVIGENSGRKYISSNTQTIGASSLLTSGNTVTGAICVGGYIYAYVSNPSAVYELWRVPTTSDSSSAGNWTKLTLSGSWDAAVNMVGFDGTDFWFIDRNGSTLFKASLSGTTMTRGSNVTVTGCDTNSSLHRVNSTGVYAKFSSAPLYRKADLSGNLVADQLLNNSNSVFVTPNDVYSSDSTTTPYVKVTF